MSSANLTHTHIYIHHIYPSLQWFHGVTVCDRAKQFEGHALLSEGAWPAIRTVCT